MAWQHWFIPHKDTHKKAHLISWEGMLIYVLFFIMLQVGFSIISYTKPGILGISGNIDQKKLIELTNVERQKAGLSPVKENEALDKAAALKAQNMFSENYWAHFSPSGKSPWDFILGAGYRFTFAGENLAKNFSESDAVVRAWMVSPTHRENILNSKYQDIGIAVAEGTLNGQQTIVVVQEFGATNALAAKPTVEVQGKQIEVSKQEYNKKPELIAQTPEEKKPDLVAAVSQTKPASQAVIRPLFDPYQIYKILAFALIGLVVVLLALDVWILRKRGVFRLSSHNFAHMALLSLTAGTIFVTNPGAVLSGNTLSGQIITLPTVTPLNILIAGILVYLSWALLHHKKNKSLTLPIMLEYLLFAALVLVLILGVKF